MFGALLDVSVKTPPCFNQPEETWTAGTCGPRGSKCTSCDVFWLYVMCDTVFIFYQQYHCMMSFYWLVFVQFCIYCSTTAVIPSKGSIKSLLIIRVIVTWVHKFFAFEMLQVLKTQNQEEDILTFLYHFNLERRATDEKKTFSTAHDVWNMTADETR